MYTTLHYTTLYRQIDGCSAVQRQTDTTALNNRIYRLFLSFFLSFFIWKVECIHVTIYKGGTSIYVYYIGKGLDSTRTLHYITFMMTTGYD